MFSSFTMKHEEEPAFKEEVVQEAGSIFSQILREYPYSVD